MKKIISILICIQIALFPAFAFAANVGGWTLSNPVAKGAKVVYDGAKSVIIDGREYLKKGTATIAPAAKDVSKVLARGGAGYALSVAVEQLLGSVDWVLDPENNRIKYWEEGEGGIYQVGGYADTKSSSQEAACRKYYDLYKTGSYEYKGAIGDECYWTNPDAPDRTFKWPIFTVQTGEKEEKYLPLPTAAQQVISNAAGGDSSAQQATVAAAADIINEAEKDNTKARPIANQLDANATTKPADAAEAEKANEATGEAKPNTTNPDATDLSLEFPIFCNWAPTVCEAAQTVINFPNTLTDWWETSNTKADSWASSIAEAWTSVKEWATGEPDLQEDQTDLPIEEQTLDRDPSSFDTDYIVLGSQCPSFEPYTVEVGPISKTLSMDLSPLCDFAAQVRPAILGMSYLTAAGIVVAAIRET